MMLSVYFTAKHVLYKHSDFLWLKIGMVQFSKMNGMAETTRNT